MTEKVSEEQKAKMSDELLKQLLDEANKSIEESVLEWQQPENLLSAYKTQQEVKDYKTVILPDWSPSGLRNHRNFMKVFEWLSMNFDQMGKLDRMRLVYLLENHDMLPKGSYEKVKEYKKW